LTLAKTVAAFILLDASLIVRLIAAAVRRDAWERLVGHLNVALFA
jgi:hypothetical protein